VRIAVLSDVHGNLEALEAALTDIGDVEAHWVLGDLVAHGPRPVECVRRVAGLPGLVAVRGNTDRYVLTEPPDPVMTRSFDWTRALLREAGLLDWLASLPLEQRASAPDGSTVLMVHASPGRDDGPGLDPDSSDEELSSAAGFTVDAADLVLVGHTHRPDVRRLAGVVVVNPGPISLPRTSDAATRYAVLAWDTAAGWQVEHRVVPYDRDAVLEDLDAVGHPSAVWLREKLTTPWG
jgi:predicted phosphodiesterase